MNETFRTNVDLDMWTCGYVDMWICGYVMWICGYVDIKFGGGDGPNLCRVKR